jgi:hypothetical protein
MMTQMDLSLNRLELLDFPENRAVLRIMGSPQPEG